MKYFLPYALTAAMTALPLYGIDAPATMRDTASPALPEPPPPLPPPPNKTERLKHILLVRDLLLDKYDTGKDGKLDANEKETLLKDADLERKKAREAFLKRYDRDGNGKLSHEERKAMDEDMKKRGKHIFRGAPQPPAPPPGTAGHHPPHMVMENRKHERFSVRPPVFMLAHSLLLRKYDANGNGAIDPAEFDKIMMDANRLYADKTRQLLAKYDKDGNGILSAEEKAAIPRKQTPAEAASEQNAAIDDIDLFIQESFDTELIESMEEAEAESDDS